MWLNVRSVVDIAIVSFIFYRILVLLVGTRAVQLVKGVMILVILSAVASFLRFRLLSWFLGHALFALSFAIPIVFQPELRKMLEELGRGNLYMLKRRMSTDEAESRVRNIAEALKRLKAQKIGALLVFQREVGLGEYITSGVPLNAGITQELIVSIFWKNNPLHDGAVILDRYNLIAGACILPLSDAPGISRDFGTRHRAAVGISEVSDALVFVVSEQRGEISLAVKGQISKNLKDFQVERLLMHYFIGSQQSRNWKARLKELADLFWTTKTDRPLTGEEAQNDKKTDKNV